MSEEVEETRKAIKKKGARWRAEKTSMSELSDEEKKGRLGLLPTEEELKEIKRKKARLREEE